MRSICKSQLAKSILFISLGFVINLTNALSINTLTGGRNMHELSEHEVNALLDVLLAQNPEHEKMHGPIVQ